MSLDDWDDAPEWANYRTTDSDQERTYWELKPEWRGYFWIGPPGGKWKVISNKNPQDSLESRPGARKETGK